MNIKSICNGTWRTSVSRLIKVTIRSFQEAVPDNKGVFTVRTVIAVFGALIPLVIMWLYSRAIGALSTPSARDLALWFVVAALLVGLIDVLMDVVSGLAERLMWQRIVMRFQLLYFSRKAGLGAAQLENPTLRDLITKAQERGVYPLANIVDGQINILNSAVRLIGALIVVVTFDWRLAIVIAISLLPQLIVDIRHGRTLWDINDVLTDDRRKYSEMNRHFYGRTTLVELLLFQNVRYFLGKITNLLDSFRLAQEKAERKRHQLLVYAAVFGAIVYGGAMVSVVMKVISGAASLQEFVFVWGSTASLQGILRAIVRSIATQHELALNAHDLYAVIDTPPESVSRTGTLQIADRVPDIRLENVSFHYPWDKPERLILKDVSLHIRKGERVALVGENGAGKTTLIKLLAGVYVPTTGRILIDGVDMREIDIESWRRHIVALLQDYTHYRVPIKELVSLGDTSSPLLEERVIEAARASGAHAFIADLPHGYDTIPSKDFAGGTDVSGGQVQRLALARVWYRHAKVVILDEPTASLDVIAEEQIFDEIARRPRGETVILITHRFNTIRSSDHIIVLDGGRVSEEGTHKTLMSRCGLYARMFKKQAAGYMEPIQQKEED